MTASPPPIESSIDELEFDPVIHSAQNCPQITGFRTKTFFPDIQLYPTSVTTTTVKSSKNLESQPIQNVPINLSWHPNSIAMISVFIQEPIKTLIFPPALVQNSNKHGHKGHNFRGKLYNIKKNSLLCTIETTNNSLIQVESPVNCWLISINEKIVKDPSLIHKTTLLTSAHAYLFLVRLDKKILNVLFDNDFQELEDLDDV